MAGQRSSEQTQQSEGRGALLFFTEFWKHRRDIGSIVPSSRFLIDKMLRWVDFQRARVIVELGPGEGCVTRPLLKRMRPDARLLVFEINEAFCDLLRDSIQDDRLEVVQASAERLHEELAARGFEAADYLISGLPFINFPDSLRQAIWKQIQKVIGQEGRYIQYHYSGKLYQQYQRLFGEVHMGYTLLNIPPAYVFACSKPKIK